MRKSLLLLATALSANVRGECGCFCTDGALTTMCTTVAEAQADPELCSAIAAGTCPASPLETQRTRYSSPEEGAINCRVARVWDASRATFADVRVCDVMP